MPMVPFGDLPDSARVWIFAADEPLGDAERARILSAVDSFLDTWTAHGAPLRGGREIVYDRFLVVGVDEGAALPSGCSIDALVRVFKGLESALGRSLLDRSSVWYRGGGGAGRVERASRAEFKALARDGKVTGRTVVFDNAVTRMDRFRGGGWEKEARDSWHGRLFASGR